VAAACWSFSRYNSLSETHRKLEYDVEQLRKTNGELTVNIARAEERLQLSETERQRERNDLENRFKAIANDILLNNSREISQQNTTRLNEVLQPMKENFELFRRTITESYDREARERFSLADRIKELMELNRVISDETHRLTDALKGNSKMQGDWGEMILETLLAKAGFKEGEHYFLQETRDSAGNIMKTEDGRMLRPDVVVKFPPNNCVVIDSKTSLTAYVNWINATDEKSREAAGKAHVASVRKHIAELDSKAYQDHVGGDAKLDFVMMFIPNEGAYLAAMQLEPNLWQEAYDKRVLIISPTHLFSVLKLVEQMWRHDAQNKFAQQIANEAGAMYDKFAGVVDQMLEVQKRINASATVCDDVIKRLHTGNGNLVRRAEKLKELGAKASKQLKLADQDDE
jgi:DNA recombination protein RmuC